RGPARPVRNLRGQRWDGPAVPDADPRPELPAPGIDRAPDARPPDRRHDGGDGLARPDHGRRRQVTVVARAWSRVSLPGRVVFVLLALGLVGFVALTLALVFLGGPIVDVLSANLLIVRFVV